MRKFKFELLDFVRCREEQEPEQSLCFWEKGDKTGATKNPARQVRPPEKLESSPARLRCGAQPYIDMSDYRRRRLDYILPLPFLPSLFTCWRLQGLWRLHRKYAFIFFLSGFEFSLKTTF